MENNVPMIEKNGLCYAWHMNVPKSAVVKDADGTVELNDGGFKSTHEGITDEPNENTICQQTFNLHGIESVGVYVVAPAPQQIFKL